MPLSYVSVHYTVLYNTMLRDKTVINKDRIKAS